MINSNPIVRQQARGNQIQYACSSSSRVLASGRRSVQTGAYGIEESWAVERIKHWLVMGGMGTLAAWYILRRSSQPSAPVGEAATLA